MARDVKNPEDWISTAIGNFINESPKNTLKNPQNDKAWADPLVGFCRGDDPLYQKYKEVVGSFHWTLDSGRDLLPDVSRFEREGG